MSGDWPRTYLFHLPGEQLGMTGQKGNLRRLVSQVAEGFVPDKTAGGTKNK